MYSLNFLAQHIGSWEAQFEFVPSSGTGVESSVTACIDFETYVPATTIFDMNYFVMDGKWK